LQITNITQNSATASWNAVQSATNGYQVLVNPGGLLFGTASTNDSNSVSITGLTASTAYTAQVRSRGVNGSGASAYSAEVNFNTLSGPPSAPTFAEVQATGGPTYRMDWNTGTGATSYDYQFSTSSSFSSTFSSGNTASLSIQGAYIVGQRIYGRVRSVNASGVSAWKVADPVTGVVLS
jgi:hypothetical protein